MAETRLSDWLPGIPGDDLSTAALLLSSPEKMFHYKTHKKEILNHYLSITITTKKVSTSTILDSLLTFKGFKSVLSSHLFIMYDNLSNIYLVTMEINRTADWLWHTNTNVAC